MNAHTRIRVLTGLLVSVLSLTLQQPASAYSSAELRAQIKACESRTEWSSAYQDVKILTCGYGQAEFGGLGLIAKDMDRDTHCQYSRKYNSSTGRFVELKSCGSWANARVGSSDLSLGNCITGHWYCYYK